MLGACPAVTGVAGVPQTLTDKEYQRLRDAAVAIIREMGVECGGSNVQMGINPVDGAFTPVCSSARHDCRQTADDNAGG